MQYERQYPELGDTLKYAALQKKDVYQGSEAKKTFISVDLLCLYCATSAEQPRVSQAATQIYKSGLYFVTPFTQFIITYMVRNDSYILTSMQPFCEFGIMVIGKDSFKMDGIELDKLKH